MKSPAPSVPSSEKQPVNWEAARMLALAVGVREAARRLGIPETAMLKRSSREKWFADPAAKAALAAVPHPKSSAHVIKMSSVPAHVMAAAMIEEAIRGRYAALRAGATGLEYLADMGGAGIVEKAPAYASLCNGAAKAGGWSADQRPDSPARSFGSRGESLVIDTEFEVESAEMDQREA